MNTKIFGYLHASDQDPMHNQPTIAPDLSIRSNEQTMCRIQDDIRQKEKDSSLEKKIEMRLLSRRAFLSAVEFLGYSQALARLSIEALSSTELLEVWHALQEKQLCVDRTATTFTNETSLRSTLGAMVQGNTEHAFEILDLSFSAIKRTRIEIPRVPSSIAQFGALLGLCDLQTRVLTTVFAMSDIRFLSKVLFEAGYREAFEIAAYIMDIPVDILVEETSPGSFLHEAGIIGFRIGRDEITDIRLTKTALFAIRSGSSKELRAGLFDPPKHPRFSMQPSTLSTNQIESCKQVLGSGGSLLLSGQPGTGKTEFALSLAAELKRAAYCLAASIEGTSQSDDRSRLTAVRIASRIMDSDQEVLLVDEADALLQSATGSFNKPGGTEVYDKARLNSLLEELAVPSIWITNDTKDIPSSSLRRFAYVVQFPTPRPSQRAALLAEHLHIREKDQFPLERIASQYDFTPAVTARLAKLISRSAERGFSKLLPHGIDEIYQNIESFLADLAANPLVPDVQQLPLVSNTIHETILDSNPAILQLSKKLKTVGQNLESIRILLSGPPSSGKSQIARWFGIQFDRDIDIIGDKDVQTAQSFGLQTLSARFAAAVRNNKLIVIDDAERFIPSIRNSQNSFHEAFAGEIKEWITTHPGPVIACTRNPDMLDPSMHFLFNDHISLKRNTLKINQEKPSRIGF